MGRTDPLLALTILIGAIAVPASGFGQGYKQDDLAALAGLPHISRYRAFLPASKDLSDGFPSPGDQGDQGSCVAWTVGYDLSSFYDHKRRQTPYSGSDSVFSPAFIYNQLTESPGETPGGCQDGLDLREALGLLRAKGVATMADFPYQARSCRRKPDQSVMQHAASHTIAGYQVVGSRGAIRADDVKGQIAAGNPVPVGLNINPKVISALRGGEIYDRGLQGETGGHAVVVTGYDDRRQAFKFINSWGPHWADHGFGWISYRAFEADVHAAFVVNDGGPSNGPANDPVPAVTPDLAAWAKALAGASKNFQCSTLSLRANGDSEVAVLGFVSKQADLDVVGEVVRAAPAGLHVTVAGLRLRPWPQCEALLTLSEVVKADHGITMDTIDHPTNDYAAGNRLTLRVKSPDFPSYLYVAYIDASGAAASLYRPRGVVPQALPPGTVVELGGGSDPRVFQIGPPYGAEMVVAVAAASPLFTDGLPPSSTDREYLTALRKTLEYKPDPSQPDRLVDAEAIALTTHAGAP